jgi:hypothetical protein
LLNTADPNPPDDDTEVLPHGTVVSNPADVEYLRLISRLNSVLADQLSRLIDAFGDDAARAALLSKATTVRAPIPNASPIQPTTRTPADTAPVGAAPRYSPEIERLIDLINKHDPHSIARMVAYAIGDDPENWITPKQAADELGRHYQTILDMVRAGQVGHQKIHGSVRVYRPDIEALKSIKGVRRA